MSETLPSAVELIPQPIVASYYPDGIFGQELLTGGHINTTFLITDVYGQQSILQRLNHATNDATAKDYQVLSSHLQAKGWELASIRESQSGDAYLRDESGKLWRSLTYIESETTDTLEKDTAANIALAGLLGRLHCDLATLDYIPQNVVSSYRDVRHFVERLTSLIPEIPSTQTRNQAADMLAAGQKNTIDHTASHLVHGDPRMANTLARGGEPFTFIDWDGLTIASPFFDIGDLLQSTVSRFVSHGETFSRDTLHDLLAAYYIKAQPEIDEEFFIQTAQAAGKSVALCLGMRCLIDSVEDYYFGWEASGFASRKEFNLYRASRQWNVYQALDV